MPWEIPKKIALQAVTVLFLFAFFNLILDAPRRWRGSVRGGGGGGQPVYVAHHSDVDGVEVAEGGARGRGEGQAGGHVQVHQTVNQKIEKLMWVCFQ